MMWCPLLLALLLSPETIRGANHHIRPACDILIHTTRTPGPLGQPVIDKVTVASNDREVSKNNAAMDKVAVIYAGSLWHDGEKIICPLLNSNGRWIDTPFTKEVFFGKGAGKTSLTSGTPLPLTTCTRAHWTLGIPINAVRDKVSVTHNTPAAWHGTRCL